MKAKGKTAPCLALPLVILFKPENKSQSNFLKDPSSYEMKRF